MSLYKRYSEFAISSLNIFLVFIDLKVEECYGVYTQSFVKYFFKLFQFLTNVITQDRSGSCFIILPFVYLVSKELWKKDIFP